MIQTRFGWALAKLTRSEVWQPVVVSTKSVDGGKSWSNVGLEDSGHISQIWINPNDSDEVIVASQRTLVE